MDSIVIRIRYRDLSAGLHGKAMAAGRSTTVYLRPGLTGRQRTAVLRRLRQEARVGRGPRLPSGQLAVAIAADRVRSSAARVLAVVRLHPAAALVPSLLLGATAGLLLMAAMSTGGSGTLREYFEGLSPSVASWASEARRSSSR